MTMLAVGHFKTSAVHSAFSRSISRIIEICSNEEMLWIETKPIVTFMKDAAGIIQ